MNASARHGGYALLAAVLVTALAAAFVAAAVAAVSARQHVTRADHAGAIADDAARQVIASLCTRLWRSPSLRQWTLSGSPESAGDVSWEARCSELPSASSTSWPCAELDVAVTTPSAARRVKATVNLEAVIQAQGVVVAHDLAARAPMNIEGGGVYCGGCVSGREWVSLGAAGDGGTSAADSVHGEVWPVAAVHALGSVWAAGHEIHANGQAECRFASDTDMHTGSNEVAELTQEPDLTTISALTEIGVPPAGALVDGVLDLAELPPSLVATDSGAGSEPYVVVIPPRDGTTTVVGARASGTPPVVVVLEGDAVLGKAGGQTRFEGAVVACRDLEIAGPTALTGHLYAGSMSVDGPLSISTPLDWRARPLPGLVRPVVVTLGR